MDYMWQLSLVRLVKFASVFAYAGGVGVGLFGDTVQTRKRAVHLLASPALLVVWLSGYLLSIQMRVALHEAWVLGGFLCSLLAHGLLTRAARQETPPRSLCVVILASLGGALAFMIFRPTWWRLLP
jgi:hypothetical protein